MREEIGKVSIKDIRATYSKEKMVSERRNKEWLYYAGRQPSFYLTWLFLWLNISANQATYIGLVVGLISCIFLGWGSYIFKLVGILIATLYLVLDCVDGNIARYRGVTNKYGEFIDGLNSYFINAFFFISIGIGAFNNPELVSSMSLIKRGIPINKYWFLILGLWTAFSYVFARLVSQRYEEIFGRETTTVTPVISKNLDKNYPFISFIISNLFGIGGFFIPLVLLSIIFKLLGLLVFVYAMVNTVVFGVNTIKLLLKANKA